MINFEEETLQPSHCEEFQARIKKLQVEFSEYTFANLYLFRKQHDYRVFNSNGYLFLKGVTYDGERYLMPFDKISDIDRSLLHSLMEEGYSIFPVNEKDLIYFPQEIYNVTFNEDDSDYIYTTEKIKEYPGRKLHKKRNLLKQYRTLYDYVDLTYDCTKQADAVKVLEKWFSLANAPVDETDYAACLEAIERCDQFALSGQIYYANNEPVGMLLGEELNEETFVIHFAKGVTDYKGIYVHMYNSLAWWLPAKYKLLNFEQDLGKENLRQAKSTYLQDYMQVKYRVKLKR